MLRVCYLFLGICFLFSCSVEKKIAKSASGFVLKDSSLLTAHVGISVFEPETNKYWYNYQGDHFFVPASNTKIPTCYAAMKYLGDSLVGLRYTTAEERSSKEVLVILPTGDPSFMHPDYSKQPVFDFFKTIPSDKKELGFYVDSSYVEKWGSGWSWNDYDQAYMAERCVFPVFGNVINIKLNNGEFKTQSHYFDTIVNKPANIIFDADMKGGKVTIERALLDNNVFLIKKANSLFTGLTVPFATGGYGTALEILSDTFKVKFDPVLRFWGKDVLMRTNESSALKINKWNTIHSQPTDSLLKPMMHRSDNFFAEQSLLMVSNELLGVMNDDKIIDTLLKTDFKDLPQKPRWADGSGLSRYNLFTPQDFVMILNKMKNEFGMDRIKLIFPTGGEGTISSYYKPEAGYIFAKTGTLSGVVALSGFLYTRKNKLLIFSVLVNNHRSASTDVRRAVEKFIQELRLKY